MGEELAIKAGLSLIDYGVLGVFCLLLIIVTVYLGKSAVSSKEVMVEIKELLKAQVAQLEAQKERDEIFFNTIDFERTRNKQCYDLWTNSMTELKKNVTDLTTELKLCQVCKK